MASDSLFPKFIAWLKSPEVFGSITKNIPGKWQLFEYYVDLEENLINLKEEDIKTNKESLIVEFNESGQLEIKANLPLSIFKSIENGTWSVHRNFITFVHPSDFRNNVEFQFAFEKGNLKLLKKDKAGRIEFFGFFKRLSNKT